MKMARRVACEQAAVVPYRVRSGLLEVALITSSDGKRWILPKGWVDHGEALLDAALREAAEEAGLLGRVSRAPFHRYVYAKAEGRLAVAVFLMQVTGELESWPEDHRRRRWLPLDEAHERLRCTKLRAVLQAARRRLRRA